MIIEDEIAIQCQVCGQKIELPEDVLSVAPHWSHVYCSLVHREWHMQAARLLTELNQTVSPSLKKIIHGDLDRVLLGRKMI